jgi:hypothetical protein
MGSNILVFISKGAESNDLLEINKKSRGGAVFSSTIYAKKISDAFKKCYQEVVEIRIPPVSWWPKYSSIIWAKNKTNTSQEKSNHDIRFLNIFGLRNLSMSWHIRNALKFWLPKRLHNVSNFDVVIFEATYPQLTAAKFLKKRYPKVKTSLIVPDLPELTNFSIHKYWYKKLKNIDSNLVYKIAKSNIDSFVFFSPFMLEKFNVSQKPFLISEGIADKMWEIKPPEEKKASFVVVYTGIISNEYANINLAIDSVNMLNQKISSQLLLAGPCTDLELLNRFKNEKHVVYLGTLSPEKAKELQQDADILLNLRPNQPDFRYSFPSKLISYMQAGKPILTTKLLSIPPKFDEALFYVEEFTPKSISNSLFLISKLSKKERLLLVSKQKELIEKLSADNLAREISSMLNNIENKSV